MKQKQQILATKKLSEKELEKRVKALIDAKKVRSKWSAYRVIWEEVKLDHIGDKDVVGFALEAYDTQRGTSVYVMLESGDVERVKYNDETGDIELKRGQQISLAGCAIMTDKESQKEWLETTKDTKVTLGDVAYDKFLGAVPRLGETPKEGLRVYRGHIQTAFKKSTQESFGAPREERELMPIFDEAEGKINITIYVSSSGDEERENSYEVKIKKPGQLQELLGEDISWVNGVEGVEDKDIWQEIRFTLEGREVLFFSYCRDTKRRPDEESGTWEEQPSKFWFDAQNYGFIAPIDED